MKNRFFLTIIGLLMAVLSSAQSLDGTWNTDLQFGEQKDSANVSVALTLDGHDRYVISGNTFKEQVKAVFLINAEKEDKKVSMSATITCKNAGTLARTGDIIVFTPNKGSKPEVSIVTDKDFPGLLKTMLVNPMKNEIVRELKKESKFRLVSLTDTEMVLEDILTEKELKKGETPERTTYEKL